MILGKHCPSCQKNYPIDAFDTNNARGDGLQSYCRRCRKLRRVTLAQKNIIFERAIRLERFRAEMEKARPVEQEQEPDRYITIEEYEAAKAAAKRVRELNA